MQIAGASREFPSWGWLVLVGNFLVGMAGASPQSFHDLGNPSAISAERTLMILAMRRPGEDVGERFTLLH